MLTQINYSTAAKYKNKYGNAPFKITKLKRRAPAIVSIASALIQIEEKKLDEKKIEKTKSAEIKLHRCDVCDKTFPSKNMLTRHRKTHPGEKPYKCEYCNEGFTKAGNFTSHKRTHTGKKPYECGVCKKCFTRSDTLGRHQKTHSGVKPYSCTWDGCLKSFARLHHLKIHLRTHTGERPYKCSQCRKAFSESGNCNRHIKKRCNSATVIHEGL